MRAGIKMRVGPPPALFEEKCPGEPWCIWVHKQACHFEWDSFGASAGFMRNGTEVSVLKHWTINLTAGSMAGLKVEMIKVRGPNENGKQITGWALLQNFVE